MAQADDFVARLGRAFVAHRLRRLSEHLLASYAEWLPEAGVTAPPRALSTMLLLKQHGPTSVGDIAARLRLSHPLIIKLVAELKTQGLVSDGRNPADARRRVITLTTAGRSQAGRIVKATQVMDDAFVDLFGEAAVDLLAAVEAVEAATARHALGERLRRAARHSNGGG